MFFDDSASAFDPRDNAGGVKTRPLQSTKARPGSGKAGNDMFFDDSTGAFDPRDNAGGVKMRPLQSKKARSGSRKAGNDFCSLTILWAHSILGIMQEGSKRGLCNQQRHFQEVARLAMIFVL